MSSSPSQLVYVYGIVPAEPAPGAGASPAGIDDVPVEIVQGTGASALVSVLDGGAYAPAEIESRSGDVEWLSARAMAHDRVLTWASDRGAVIPLPMFSMFSGDGAVRDMLRDRGWQLAETLRRVARGREYALRTYRVDAELLSSITSLSPRLQELAASAASATPGQRYLLERKLEAEKKSEMRGVTQRIVDDIVAALSECAEESLRAPIPRVSDAETTRGTMVLNAAFLVSPAKLEEFRRRMTSIVEERTAQGFRFDFTGPWPPYHFVGERSHDA
jgi:hypothetical protein